LTDRNIPTHSSHSFLQRNCPICNQSDRLIEHVVTSLIRAENSTFDELVNYWIGLFKERVFFSYSRCKNCNLLYSRQYFNDEQLRSLYSKMPENMSEVVKKKCINKTHQDYYSIFSKYSSLKGNYLEIGPDTGFFSYLCLKHGYFENFYLYEPNRLVWESLKERLNGVNYYLSDKMDNFTKIQGDSISSVVMIHVLDHLVDPLNALRVIKTKLRRNGILAIVTHDESSFITRFSSNRWPAYCLQHPQLFNKESINNLLSEAGFRILTIKKTVNYFPLTFILNNIIGIFNLKKVRFPEFKYLDIPMKLGNIMTIAITNNI